MKQLKQYKEETYNTIYTYQKKRTSQFNHLTSHLKNLGKKKRENEPKASGRKENNKIEINKIENRFTEKNVNGTNN